MAVWTQPKAATFGFLALATVSAAAAVYIVIHASPHFSALEHGFRLQLVPTAQIAKRNGTDHGQANRWTREYSIPELRYESQNDCDSVRPSPVNNCLKMSAAKGKRIGGVDARDAWHALHATLIQEATYGRDAKVVFLGDSITESWRGTNWGQQCDRCKGIPEVFREHFGKYGAVALGIGCDATQHLLWRLQAGEVEGFKPAVVVLLIGTNNLGVCNATAGSTVQGIEAVLTTLHQKLPRAQILMLGLYPRGRTVDGWRTKLQPGEFSERMQSINAALLAGSKRDSKVHFVDCNAVFLDEGGNIRPDLMPDFLHPSKSGAEALTECLAPEVHRLVNAVDNSA